jgi:hypothetical protein
MPKNKDVCRPAVERYVHLKAVAERRAKLREDRRYEVERQQREVLHGDARGVADK